MVNEVVDELSTTEEKLVQTIKTKTMEPKLMECVLKLYDNVRDILANYKEALINLK